LSTTEEVDSLDASGSVNTVISDCTLDYTEPPDTLSSLSYVFKELNPITVRINNTSSIRARIVTDPNSVLIKTPPNIRTRVG
jgi:hypothetical protein